jgi:cell division protein FtsX
VKAVHPIGAVIAGILSAWASFHLFRGSLKGAPPMYSHGWFQRGLHFMAGIIFACVAVAVVFILAGRL